MTQFDRRSFLCAATASATALAHAATPAPIRLGIVVFVRKGETPDAVVKRVRKFGFPTCQIGFNDLTLRDATPL